MTVGIGLRRSSAKCTTYMVMGPTTTTTMPALGYGVDHLEALANWFEACNGAQQATVAVKLLSRANPKAAHLVHGFLQHRLLVTSAIWRQEVQRANDPGKPLARSFIAGPTREVFRAKKGTQCTADKHANQVNDAFFLTLSTLQLKELDSLFLRPCANHLKYGLGLVTCNKRSVNFTCKHFK